MRLKYHKCWQLFYMRVCSTIIVTLNDFSAQKFDKRGKNLYQQHVLIVGRFNGRHCVTFTHTHTHTHTHAHTHGDKQTQTRRAINIVVIVGVFFDLWPHQRRCRLTTLHLSGQTGYKDSKRPHRWRHMSTPNEVFYFTLSNVLSVVHLVFSATCHMFMLRA